MTASRRNHFFLAMAAGLLALVLVGFSPTFYLKVFFETPELPWYLHVHGVALTVWFALLLVQTLLIETRRTRAHRRLGRLGAAVSIVLVLTTILLILTVESSRASRGISPQQPLAFVVLGDFAALIGFSVLLSVGVAFRRRPAVHKRAMLLAFIALAGPAFQRSAHLRDDGMGQRWSRQHHGCCDGTRADGARERRRARDQLRLRVDFVICGPSFGCSRVPQRSRNASRG